MVVVLLVVSHVTQSGPFGVKSKLNCQREKRQLVLVFHVACLSNEVRIGIFCFSHNMTLTFRMLMLWTGACNCYQYQSHCQVIAVHRHPKFHLAILWGFNEVKASICMPFTSMKINHHKKENWACLSLPCVLLVTVKKMEMLTALDNFERNAACS